MRQGLKRPGCAMVAELVEAARRNGSAAYPRKARPAPQLKFSVNIAAYIRNNPDTWMEDEYFL